MLMPVEHAVRVLFLLIVRSQLEETPTVWVFRFLHGTSLFLMGIDQSELAVSP